LWDAALPLARSPAAHYLSTRGLAVPDGGALRFLPDTHHPSGAVAGCLLALAMDGAGRGQAVHRTYLTPGGTGKAKLDPPRATLGPIRGAAVRLCRHREGEPLVIGEGVETSLSAGLLTGHPAWAALSASNMRALHLPVAVREVWLAADHDPPGQRAAASAADALLAQGRRVRVLTPDAPGLDFNDLWQRRWAVEAAHG
jgi:hypothetical protein